MENNFISLVDAHRHFLDNGFDKNYKVIDNTTMVDDNGKSYKPCDIEVIDFYRFEGESDPSDNSIIYGIKTCDGKGTIVSSYGSEGSRKFSEFIMKQKWHQDNTMFKKLIKAKDKIKEVAKSNEKVILGISAGLLIGIVIGNLIGHNEQYSFKKLKSRFF